MNRRRMPSSAAALTSYGELERHRARAQELRAQATAATLASAGRRVALLLRAAARQAQRGWRRLAVGRTDPAAAGR